MDIVDIIMDKLAQIPGLIVTFAPSILFALVIFIVGRFIVRKASRGTEVATQKIPNIDLTLARFFASIVLFGGMFAVIILAMSALKINLAFLATVVAALVIALGFALQETLGDLASGIMLAVFRPFQVGEEVEIGGENGVVRDMGLFATRLLTRDNVLVSVGNGNVFGNTIKNYYAYETRRLDMEFGVSYDADLNQTIDVILKAALEDERIHKTPEPSVKVNALGDSAVIMFLRVWCDADDHRKVKFDMSIRVKKALDAAGIEIPYEHNVIVRR